MLYMSLTHSFIHPIICLSKKTPSGPRNTVNRHVPCLKLLTARKEERQARDSSSIIISIAMRWYRCLGPW